MAETTFISQFAVHQTCRDLHAQIKLYTEYGFVVDDGYDVVGDIPDEYFKARSVLGSDLLETRAMKLPADPFMHIVFNQFKDPKFGPKWPATYDQIGSRAHSFMVRSIDTEMARIRRDFPQTKILHEPLSVHRKWGLTKTVLMLDPDSVFFELIEIDPNEPYFARELKAPPPTKKSWLHYMLCTENQVETARFYKAFGMSHDGRVDFREAVAFHPYSQEKFAKEHEDAFKMKFEDAENVHFLRNLNDLSNTHLEVLECKQGALSDPCSKPIWPQKGISRYCFKTEDYEGDLKRSRECGHHIYIPENKICVQWGDTEYYYFGDTDLNILTSEQWHPYGWYGEKI